MELEQQLRVIIDNAADYGIAPVVIERAIAPVLELFARQLKHLEYYVLQNLQGNWVVTTIAHPQFQQEQKVIYGFVSVQDAATFAGRNDPDLMAMPMPIADLLFRLFSLESVDSLIVLEDSQNLNRGTKIERQDLVQSIQQQIMQLGKTPPDVV